MATKIKYKSGLPKVEPIVDWIDRVYVRNKIKYKGDETTKPLLDFGFGNPHKIIDGYTDILKDTADPPSTLSTVEQNSYYAYRLQDGFVNERKYIAQKLNKESPITSNKWTHHRILLTTGAVAGLYVSISLLLNKGDEVIYFEPYWFEYTPMIEVNGGIPKPLNIYDTHNCNVLSNTDIINKIENSITNKTKLLVLNTPHNPSGTMFNDAELKLLSNILERKSVEYKHRIIVIVDEAYRDFVYDNNKYLSLTQYYPFSIIIYTYGKILLAPQQRFGWIAISPLLNNSESNKLCDYLTRYLMWSGFQLPNVVPGKGLIKYENIINNMKSNGLLQRYQTKRDLIIDTLLNKCNGINKYSVTKSKGTFYLLFKPPNVYNMDGYQYCKGLIENENTKLLAGYTFGLDAWVRVTYTAPIQKIKALCERLISYDKYLQNLCRSKL